MSNVLGTNSFLDTPDVNGTLVLLVGDATQTINGTTDQIAVTGTNPTLTAGIASNPVIPGIQKMRIPVGATADRPGTPAAGDLRFNSTLAHAEIYNGTYWAPSGTVLQVVVGNIPLTSSNVVIPYDNTLPLSTEGAALWSQSFTPISATSTIVIISAGFYSINNAADINTTVATFNGTTCFGATNVGWTTTSLDSRGFYVIATQTSGSTTARTYSARFGPSQAQTIYINQIAGGGSVYGGTANVGRFIIQEIDI